MLTTSNPLEESYFATGQLVQELLEKGSTVGHGPANRGPRHRDAEFIRAYEVTWFVREEQPFFDMWKVLYEHDGMPEWTGKWAFDERMYKKPKEEPDFSPPTHPVP